MRRRRSNAGIFQRLLEGGSRTTYHGKIRDRKGKRTAAVRQGKQSVYKGVRIIPVGNGEFETSLDSSRFESKRDARRFVDAWKRQNPRRNQGGDYYNYAVMRGTSRPGRNYIAHYNRDSASKSARDSAETFRKTHTLWGNDGSGHMTKLETWTPGKADRTTWKERGWNPGRKSGDFSRCVKAVSQRKGAKDPEAICAAQERKRGLLNPSRDEALEPSSPHAAGVAFAEFANSMAYVPDRSAFLKFVKAWAKRHGSSASAAEPDIAAGFRSTFFKTRGNPGSYYLVDYTDSFGKIHPDHSVFADGERDARAAASRNVPHGWKIDRVRPDKERNKRRNPADAAMAVSEEFHGRKVKAMIPVSQKRHYHKYLAELGELRKLEVLARDGKHRVTLSKFDGAMLCTNEDKNQLFLVGGDQGVDLRDFGIKDAHETETLGEVTKIEYFTDKEHLGSEGGEAVYVHKFRTTNGGRGHKTVRLARNPDLIYYLRDEHLEFSGGSYFIRAEGIDL